MDFKIYWKFWKFQSRPKQYFKININYKDKWWTVGRPIHVKPICLLEGTSNCQNSTLFLNSKYNFLFSHNQINKTNTFAFPKES